MSSALTQQRLRRNVRSTDGATSHQKAVCGEAMTLENILLSFPNLNGGTFVTDVVLLHQ